MSDRKSSSASTRIGKPLLRLSAASQAKSSRSSKKPVDRPRTERPNTGWLDTNRLNTGKTAAFRKDTGKAPTRRTSAKTDDKEANDERLQSRRIAYDVLRSVEEGSQLDRAFASHNDLPKLDVRDRKFVRLLVTVSLRQRGQIEKVIAPLISRRPFGAQNNANLVLLLGAAQLLILKTGAHAAVNSTVELMRTVGFERLCGLANAVMRRLTREGEARFDTTNHMDNLPAWLKKSWTHYWGAAAAEAIAKLAMQPPPLDISVRDNPVEWAKKLDAQIIDANSLRREFDGDPTQLTGFEAGAWWVQDAAAALPARLLNITEGQTAIDLCAAPGGKTAQMIATGATVTAVEQNRKRLDRLRRNLKRLKMAANLVLADGTKYTPVTPVDAVLVDAPCSSTGTIRRRPDILSRRKPEDILTLQQIQWQLATNALGWLRPGGKMVYATCSLQPEEGEDVINAIIDGAEGRYALDPVRDEEAGIFARSITNSGCVRILPNDYIKIGGVDGFFIARLVCLG